MLREKRKAEERRKHAEEASKWRERSLKAKKGGRAQSLGKRYFLNALHPFTEGQLSLIDKPVQLR